MASETHIKNLKYATIVARNGLFLLIGLTIIKATGGYLTGLVAILGDAVGSFADVISMMAIYVGLTLSQKKPSKSFTYGYHRIETFISLLISVFILFLGYRIFRESLERLGPHEATNLPIIGIITTTISIFVSYASYHYFYSIGKKVNSTALVASAYDKRNDSFVSLGVLGAVIGNTYQIPYIEGIIGMGIAVLISLIGLRSAKEALLYLLDYWDDPEVIRQIRKIIKKSKFVTGIRNIRLRHVGTYIFGEAFLEMNPFTDTKDLRDEIHRLDREIETKVEHLGDLVLYIDPPKPTKVKIAIPVHGNEGLRSKIVERPKDNFSFLFIEIQFGGIRNFYYRPERFKLNQSIKIAKFLKQEKVNILISSNVRALLYYNLRLNNIKVYPHFTNVRDVENTLKLLLLDI